MDIGILDVIKDIPSSKEWSKDDTVMEGVHALSLLADWAQTRTIAQKDKRGHNYHEANPITQKIIGKNPRVQDVDLYMALSLLGHGLISRKLPPKYRKIWQTMTLGGRLQAVMNNDRIGIGFGAKF